VHGGSVQAGGATLAISSVAKDARMCLLKVEGLTSLSAASLRLQDIDLEVHAGEVVGVVGPKGAGKRQLLELITGTQRAKGGTIQLCGDNVTNQRSSRRAQRGLASTLARPRLWARLADVFRTPTVVTCLERSLSWGRRPSRSEHQELIDDSLARFGLSFARNIRVNALSAGERHRVQWACLLAGRPKLVVVDEPFRGAEFIGESAAMIFRQVADEGVGVLLSQRDLSGLHWYDRVYVLDQGEIVANGQPERVCRKLDVLKLFADNIKDRRRIDGHSGGLEWNDSPRRQSTGPWAPTLFISYSRQDAAWVDRLERHLTPQMEEHRWQVWTDRRIQPGNSWFEEIEQAMASASAALLLVSPDYFASSFVTKHELPTLTAAARLGRVRLLWLPLRESAFRHTDLNEYQALLNPKTPLTTFPKAEHEQQIERICERIGHLLQESEVPRSRKIG
jgi:branched-chain amino acid transport system ATP-binding protein